MTFRRWRPLLDNVAPPVRAFAAYADGQPCGLALGEDAADAPGARLLSLFVPPARRRQGIGQALMRSFCKAVSGRPVWTRWSSELPQAPAFEALLAATGWSDKTLDMLQVSTSPRRVIDYFKSRPHWRMVDRVGGYSWTLWSDRSAADDDAIRAILAGGSVPAQLDAFRYAHEHPVWINSMLLRLNGAPVGWLLTQRLDDALLYDCNYVRPDLGRIGAVIPMLVAMFRRQAELLGPDSPARYFVNSSTPAMLAISRGPFRGGMIGWVEHFAATRPAE
jgi:GNAT superfamily N-acetyltransferase